MSTVVLELDLDTHTGAASNADEWERVAAVLRALPSDALVLRVSVEGP